MNYCEKIRYSIVKVQESGTFSDMMDSLFGRISVEGKILRLVVFGSPSDNVRYIEERNILKNYIDLNYPDEKPAWSYVAQPPLDAGLVVEIHSYLPYDDEVLYREYEGKPYIVIENSDGRFLYSGGWQADLCTDIYTQSCEVFRQMKGLLDKEGFPVSAIVRQWNYIERITAFDGDDQHYQMFNNARSCFYSAVNWKDGYPAATGIGSSCGGVIVDFDAVLLNSADCFIIPIDNRLQIAAHAYSDNVLLEAGRMKTTPKFERAKSLNLGSRRVVYISGTAAIRGENSLVGVGIEKQTEITLENIAHLTDNADICLFRVYLNNSDNCDVAKQLLYKYEDDVYISYLLTDVCRNELLIEIEGVAIE